MKIDSAELSLIGDRKDNQDRVVTLRANGSLLIAVVDGMGGHSQGAMAAQATVAALQSCFAAARKPLLDPQGFLTMALSLAHDAVVALVAELPLDQRPRATSAACLIQDQGSYWAHVGDSRIYQLRGGAVLRRTRDHSHVELLLREGVIEENQMSDHPLRNLVECCIGGDTPLPDICVTAQHRLAPGDTLLVCTDGLWSGVSDGQIAQVAADTALSMDTMLELLAHTAVKTSAPHSDNTSACAIRWLSQD
jgi:serine/threonine protein phosphatase PrpC